MFTKRVVPPCCRREHPPDGCDKHMSLRLFRTAFMLFKTSVIMEPERERRTRRAAICSPALGSGELRSDRLTDFTQGDSRPFVRENASPAAPSWPAHVKHFFDALCSRTKWFDSDRDFLVRGSANSGIRERGVHVYGQFATTRTRTHRYNSKTVHACTPSRLSPISFLLLLVRTRRKRTWSKRGHL